MAKRKSTASARSRQAISKAAKSLTKAATKRAKRFAAGQARAIQKAIKSAQQERDKDLVAQWRALRRYGYLRTTETPSLSRLTESRKRAIRNAYRDAQSMGTFAQGKVMRPLEKHAFEITTTYYDKRTKRYRTTKRTKIKYELAPRFKFIHSKFKPSSERGIKKTKKGYVVEVESPLSKVRITRKGEIKERAEFERGGITIAREGLTGSDILKLAEAIEKGTFKIPKGSALKLNNFDTLHGNSFAYDALDMLAERIRFYQSNMREKVFSHWLKTTDLIITSLE